MQEIRILHCVIGNMNIGGIETMLMELYRNIDREKVQFDFLVHSTKENFYEKEICQLGGRLYRVPFISRNPFLHCARFYSFLREHTEYKIIHIHTTYAIMYIDAKIAKSLGRIIVMHSHNSGANWKHSLVHYFFKSKLSSISDYKIACSAIAAKWMYSSKYQKDVCIWKNAINLESYCFDVDKRNCIRSRYNVRDKIVIGNVGRLSYQKNQKLLIKIFYQILKHYPDCVLWSIGDGEERTYLEKQVYELNLSNNVRFWGSQSNVNEFMMAFDVFVLTSRWEGLGIVLVEAQATGLPIVVPDCVDNSVQITNNIYVVNSYSNICEWMKKVQSALEKPIDRFRAYDLVKDTDFAISIQARNAENFYRTIVRDRL